MAVNKAPPEEPEFSPGELKVFVGRFKRRIAEVEKFDPDAVTNRSDPKIHALKISIEDVLREAFGYGTPAYDNYRPAATLDTARHNYANPVPLGEVIIGLHRGKDRAITLLQQAVQYFEEKLADFGVSSDDSTEAKILRAYEGLDLHPEIARAADKLYRDGHYSNAIEDSVKALNAFVRMRSGVEADGTALMETVFGPKNPVLRFNDLADQSDRDEQKGFMMLFSGAVAGLRNPRAHRLIQDDPEQALEFIAFVSLLAKLLANAKK